MDQPAPAPNTFQQRMHTWMEACFGAKIIWDRVERNHRFLEEALELVQTGGTTASEAHQLVDYVYGRPVGVADQEVGGVMTTLAALCTAYGIDMAKAGEDELTRIWGKIEQIRDKQAAKPKHSPLPGNSPAPQSAMETITRAEMVKRMKAQGVRNQKHWAFVCPICGTVQSMASLVRAGARPTSAEMLIGFSCEGRLTDAGPRPQSQDKSKKAVARRAVRGCDWTLGGLFAIHKLEVVTEDGVKHPRFEIATAEQAQQLEASFPLEGAA